MLRRQISEAVLAYRDKYNEIPTRVRLTVEKEWQCMHEAQNDWICGELLQDMMINGLRSAVKVRGNKILGLTVLWDSPDLGVDTGPDDPNLIKEREIHALTKKTLCAGCPTVLKPSDSHLYSRTLDGRIFCKECSKLLNSITKDNSR